MRGDGECMVGPNNSSSSSGISSRDTKRYYNQESAPPATGLFSVSVVFQLTSWCSPLVDWCELLEPFSLSIYIGPEACTWPFPWLYAWSCTACTSQACTCVWHEQLLHSCWQFRGNRITQLAALVWAWPEHLLYMQQLFSASMPDNGRSESQNDFEHVWKLRIDHRPLVKMYKCLACPVVC